MLLGLVFSAFLSHAKAAENIDVFDYGSGAPKEINVVEGLCVGPEGQILTTTFTYFPGTDTLNNPWMLRASVDGTTFKTVDASFGGTSDKSRGAFSCTFLDDGTALVAGSVSEGEVNKVVVRRSNAALTEWKTVYQFDESTPSLFSPEIIRAGERLYLKNNFGPADNKVSRVFVSDLTAEVWAEVKLPLQDKESVVQISVNGSSLVALTVTPTETEKTWSILVSEDGSNFSKMLTQSFAVANDPSFFVASFYDEEACIYGRALENNLPSMNITCTKNGSTTTEISSPEGVSTVAPKGVVINSQGVKAMIVLTSKTEGQYWDVFTQSPGEKWKVTDSYFGADGMGAFINVIALDNEDGFLVGGTTRWSGGHHGLLRKYSF